MFVRPCWKPRTTGEMLDLIDAHPWALLVNDGEERPLATNLPLVLDRRRGTVGTLVGHLARANEHAAALQSAPRPTLAVFHGPSSYVTASWYPRRDMPPTYYYTAVHCYGPVRFQDDEQLEASLSTLTEPSEARFYGLAVGVVIILRRRTDLPPPYRCPWCQLIPIFFLVATVGIVISTLVASFWQALLGVALILAGLPLYAVFSLQERRGPRVAQRRLHTSSVSSSKRFICDTDSLRFLYFSSLDHPRRPPRSCVRTRRLPQRRPRRLRPRRHPPRPARVNPALALPSPATSESATNTRRRKTGFRNAIAASCVPA